jgi:hypothetical protein
MVRIDVELISCILIPINMYYRLRIMYHHLPFINSGIPTKCDHPLQKGYIVDRADTHIKTIIEMMISHSISQLIANIVRRRPVRL